MRRTNNRSGFTLIELLVVIAIIAALLALTASAVLKYLNVQQTANTQTTLNKMQAALNRQVSTVKDQAMKESIPSSVQSLNLAGNDANVQNRLRVIYIKLRMRQVFPMNFGEALNLPHKNPALAAVTKPPTTTVPPSPLPALPSYVAYLGKLGINATYVSSPAYTPQPYESSACLLMALQTAQGGGGTDSADLGGGGSSRFFTLPNGNSIRAFVDAWGQPLYFSRVPAGYYLLNPLPTACIVPGGGQLGANDPGDPQGYLNSTAWPKTAKTTLFTLLTLQPLAGGTATVSKSYKLAPMIASSGQDKTLSVDPIWFSATPAGNVGDDVFSNP